MKRDEALWEICMEIYRILFKEATPSVDFDQLVKSGEAKQDDFFMKYYLGDERQMEIIEDICKEHKLTKNEKSKVKTTVLLGCSPTINKIRWEKTNNDLQK